VTLNISLTATTGNQPASLEWTLSYSTVDFISATVAPSPAEIAAGKSTTCNNGAGAQTCVLWGWNNTAISNGVIATVTLTLSNSTTNTSSTIQLMNNSAANPTGTGLTDSGNSATVTIAQVPRLNGFTCNPVSLTPPTGTSTCTVMLTEAAQGSGASIALSASPADANLPSTVTVPAGAQSATFAVTPGSVATPTLVTLAASYLGVNNSFGLTINPVAAGLSGITVAPGTISSGQTATVTVALTGSAGSSGAVVSLGTSNTTAAPVPSTVTVPQGATSATFSVKGGSVSASTATVLTASYSGVSKTTGLTVNPIPALSTITFSPSTIQSGQQSTGTVTLTEPASAGAVTVSLSSSGSSVVGVPATVTIAQNATSATFTVTPGSVTTATPVTITAAYLGVSKTFVLTINPPAPSGTLSSVAVNPSTISSGQTSTGTVTLTAPASTGAVVSLASSNMTAASVPSSVTVPTGSSSATFPISGGNMKTSTSVVVTASYLGVSDTANVTVNPAPAALASIAFTPATISSGQSATGTVTLTGSAGAGGAAVAIASSNPAVVVVPSTVTVPQNASSVTFNVTSATVATQTPVTVTASYLGVKQTFILSINPPPAALSSIAVSPSSIASGQNATVTVTLTEPAGTGGSIVSLASSNSTAVSVPTAITVPQGLLSTTFNVTGGSVTISTSVVLTSSYAGLSKTANVTVAAPVVQPPTAPGSLAATAAGSGQINLNWTASSSSVGIASYKVQRCQSAGCTSFSQITITAGTTYTDTNLAPSTSYSYQVQAADTLGNLSLLSNVASATTQAAITNSSTVSYVQSNYATPSSELTIKLAFKGSQTAGDLNIVVVGSNDSTAAVNPVTDSNGNSYTLAVGPAVVSGSLSQSIYYAKNISGGSNTVTVTFQGLPTAPEVWIFEYKGADPTNPVDVVSQNTGSSATASSGPVTTTTANDLLFAADIGATTTTGAGPGFTMRLLVNGDGVEERMAAAVGSYSATAPVSPAGSWIMQMIALRPSTGGPQLPTRPTGLAAAGSTTQINLAWSASTSSLGIANYIVQRCQGVGCTSFAQIATPVGTGYVDTGVIPNTSYSYQVQAIDTAGNLSQFSNIATAITQTSPLAGLASISLSSGTIVGGNPVTGTVTLTEPAGVNGAVVTLSSSNTTVASVPSTLTVPQGSTSATFSVTTKKVKSATAVVVSASYSGVSMNANLTVKR